MRYDNAPKSRGNVRSSLSLTSESRFLLFIHIKAAINGKKVEKSKQSSVNIKKLVPLVAK